MAPHRQHSEIHPSSLRTMEVTASAATASDWFGTSGMGRARFEPLVERRGWFPSPTRGSEKPPSAKVRVVGHRRQSSQTCPRVHLCPTEGHSAESLVLRGSHPGPSLVRT